MLLLAALKWMGACVKCFATLFWSLVLSHSINANQLSAPSISNYSLHLNLQVTELQKDRVASAGVAIEKLFANPDKDTTELIKEARLSYESKYFVILYSTFILEYDTFCDILMSIHEYIFFLDLPASEKLHDLIALLKCNASKVAGETLGVASICHHQEILQEHWSLGDIAVLSSTDIQWCLLGYVPHILLLIPFYPYLNFHSHFHPMV